MKRLLSSLLLASFFVTLSAAKEAYSYQHLLKSRNERIEQKVEEAVSRQMKDMQAEITRLKSELDKKQATQAAVSTVSESVATAEQKSSFSSYMPSFMNASVGEWAAFLKNNPEDTAYVRGVQPEELTVSLNTSWATTAHVTGKKLSTLVLGKQDATVKDAFVVSRLVKQHDADDSHRFVEHNYLGQLADHPISFDAAFNQQEVTVEYHRLFLNDRLKVAVNIPIARREHLLNHSSASLTPTEISGLQKTNFAHHYSSFDEFMPKSIARIGSSAPRSQGIFGLGSSSGRKRERVG